MKSDVIIVGAGIAGCTAAALFAAHQLRVTIIEKKERVDEYKKLCTHFIQPSALPVIKRLKLDKLIEEAGGLPNKADFWTKAGWIRNDDSYTSDENTAHGYNIERSILDPLLRNQIRKTPTITYIAGATVKSVNAIEHAKHVICASKEETDMHLKASLVVVADGRFSPTAKLLGNEGQHFPNNRFVCFAYYKDIAATVNNHSQFWILDPDMGFTYPLQNNKTLICLFIRKSEWSKWKDQMEAKFTEFVRALPDGPDIENAKRISGIYHMVEMPGVYRDVIKDSVAYIGDAGLALDPMSGVGCGFAFQSAQWLVDHTYKALLTNDGLEEALQAYRKFHERQLMPHAAGINAESLAKRDDGTKLSLYKKVRRDPELIRSFLALTGRIITPQEFQLQYLRTRIGKKAQ